jgi:hypothetical protein
VAGLLLSMGAKLTDEGDCFDGMTIALLLFMGIWLASLRVKVSMFEG